jgi:hypothetical protein
MSITRARTSSVAQGPSTRKTVLGGNDVILGGSYDYIDKVDVGAGGVASITFAGIPNTYKHLQIRYVGKWNYTTAADFTNTILAFNSDAGANYAYHSLRGNGSAASATAGASQNKIFLQVFMPSNHSSETDIFGAGVIDILDYQNTSKNKTVRGIGGFDRNGSGWSGLASGLWMNTAAISSITITNDSGLAWTQNSQFSLYGIK